MRRSSWFGTGGLIDVQGGFPAHSPYSLSQGAWPTLSCGPAPADSDHDGMTDDYETANGLNPSNAADRQASAANGYTNLENYRNGLVAVVTATKPTGAVTEPLHLYPNPTADRLTVQHPRASDAARLTVYNFVGQARGPAGPHPGRLQHGARREHAGPGQLPAGVHRCQPEPFGYLHPRVVAAFATGASE